MTPTLTLSGWPGAEGVGASSSDPPQAVTASDVAMRNATRGDRRIGNSIHQRRFARGCSYSARKFCPNLDPRTGPRQCLATVDGVPQPFLGLGADKLFA